jgi:DNA-binding XRE family transcriptional regulator
MGVEREAWSRRFNECCDESGIPPKGKNRQAIVGKRFGVSQKAARKWLEGESLPTLEKCISMARNFDVCFEWFMTERGPKRLGDRREAQTPAHDGDGKGKSDAQSNHDRLAFNRRRGGDRRAG